MEHKNKKRCLYLTMFLIISSISGFFIAFHDSMYIIKSNSMEPTLNVGDLVITHFKEPEHIKVDQKDGDVIAIESPKYYYEQGFDPIFWREIPNNTRIIHRAIKKKLVNDTWYFLTAGDNSMWQVDGMFLTLEKGDDYLLFEYNISNAIYIPETAIVGVMLFKIPFIGYLREYFSVILIGSVIIVAITSILKKLKYTITFSKTIETKKILNYKHMLVFLAMLCLMGIPLITLFDSIYFIDCDTMKPALNYGDVVYIENKNPEDINMDDIILITGPQYYYQQGFDPLFWGYLPNNTVFPSRVIDKKLVDGTWYFKTKGDGAIYPVNGMFKTLEKSQNYCLYEYNRSNVIYIPESEILGVVAYKIPFIGYVGEYYFLAVIVSLSILAIDVLLKKYNYEILIVKK